MRRRISGMSEPRTYTLICQYPDSHMSLRWVWFAPFGVPFVAECTTDVDLRAHIRKMHAIVEAIENEAEWGKMWVIRVRGVMEKKRYTREERRKHNRAVADFLDAPHLPTWEWMLRDYEVLSAEEAHPLLDWWFCLWTVAQIAASFVLIYWGISCLPK